MCRMEEEYITMRFVSDLCHMYSEYLTKEAQEEFGNFQLGQVIQI